MKVADVDRQNQVLSNIIGLIDSDIDRGYDNFEFHSLIDEESAECAVFVFSNGEKTNPALSGLATINVSDACMELNQMMKEQQGGAWTSFIMTYQNGGKAEVKYNYDPLPDA
jgi:Protein of unknown function, DUF600